MRNHNKLAPIVNPSSSRNTNKQEQPHLSGAYIRSLVKQLSSTSTSRSNKDHSCTMASKPHGQPPEDHQPQAQIAPPQPQPHKKQVRRRLHTSRPYQEKLLNMAEARREIVTALKIHRASMRQAKEQQQQQQMMQLHLQQQQEASHHAASRASSDPMSYSSYSDYHLYNSSFAHFTAPSSYSSPVTYHSTPVTPMVNSSGHEFGHLVPLPAQTLGLNLSFQGFNSADHDAKISTTCSFDPPLLLQPSPTSSYSVYSSPSVTMPSSNDLSAAVATENTSSLAVDASLHRVLDEDEMAAIYSIGEQHDIEWSDTMNLVTSAWWSKLLDSIEEKGDSTVVDLDVVGGSANTNYTTEDPLMEMPDWFSDSLGHQATKESSSDALGMHLSDYFHHNEDVTLPQMDIGEFEGWNAEWFS